MAMLMRSVALPAVHHGRGLCAAAQSLEGKVAFLTGASSGLGETTAKTLASKGMHVVLTARREQALQQHVESISQTGGSVAAFACDVSNPSSVQSAFEFANDFYGGVDFVFANAGIEGNLMQSAHEETEDSVLESMVNINVTGQLFTLKHAVNAFKERGGGTIVFSSSLAGHCGPRLNEIVTHDFGLPPGSGTAYQCTKAALDMIAESAAGCYGKLGVRVFNMNIGEFGTEMGDRLQFKDGQNGFNPILKDRLGDPQYIADCIVSLLDGTSAWPPGSAFVVDNFLTIDSKYFMKSRREPEDDANLGWPSSEFLKTVACDLQGRPYKW